MRIGIGRRGVGMGAVAVVALIGALAAAPPASAAPAAGCATASPVYTVFIAEAALGGTVYLGAFPEASESTRLDIPAGVSTTIDLCGRPLTIAGLATGLAGVHVPVGASLRIVDSAGGGSLTATGGQYGGPGIGGDSRESAGSITIDAGTVTATGGATPPIRVPPGGGAAGIGAGYMSGWGGATGTVVINGGTVIANGGPTGAGIGSGYSDGGYQGTTTINGGTVVATGGGQGAGIGGGSWSSAGTVVINGGNVTANGGGAASGIGGGYTGSGGTVVINGGIVHATGGGGDGGPGIGPAWYNQDQAPSAITIAGGTVTATGSASIYNPNITTTGKFGTSAPVMLAGTLMSGTLPASLGGNGRPDGDPVAASGPGAFTLSPATPDSGPITITFVDGLRVTPSATTAQVGDTITIATTALDTAGAPMADVSALVTLSDDVAEDTIEGNTVTFGHASIHTITATYAGRTTSVAVQVDAPAADTGASDAATPTLAETGADPSPWLLGGLALVLAGAGLALARRPRRN